jgi:hypothetical protein
MCVPNLRFPPDRKHVSVLLDTSRYENHENHCFSYVTVSDILLTLAKRDNCEFLCLFNTFDIVV